MDIANEMRASSEDEAYNSFVGRVQKRLQLNTQGGTAPVFTTNFTGKIEPWQDYLSAFPEAQRQYHTCHACRRFFEQYGALVVIDDQGHLKSALWDVEDAPEHYRPSIAAVVKLLERARVDGVFYSEADVWGLPVNDSKKGARWTHFAVAPSTPMIHRERHRSAYQRMAEKREDFKNVSVALGEYRRDVVEQAVRILEADALTRSEKVLGAARWLLNRLEDREDRPRVAHNLMWLAVALAPAGFAHPRSSMIGTLLDDLGRGMPLAEVQRRWSEKMHPARYQRPQAAPAAGAIAEAEKLVEKLGLAPALKRRYARLSEIEAVWRPAPAKIEEGARGGGVFSHITPKGEQTMKPVDLPPAVMTWSKFQREVLPEAASMRFCVPAHGSFVALTTASDPSAPPILQWDREEKRNPFSWYMWVHGSRAEQWGLKAGDWQFVSALTTHPSHWHGERANHANALVVVLDGARETVNAGLALFPETLRSELHGIRSVVEAHSRAGKLEGLEEASACGYGLGAKEQWRVRIRVTDKRGDEREYTLDRWD